MTTYTRAFGRHTATVTDEPRTIIRGPVKGEPFAILADVPGDYRERIKKARNATGLMALAKELIG